MISMESMFEHTDDANESRNCSGSGGDPVVSAWDVSEVTNMRAMFHNNSTNSKYQSLDVSKWKVHMNLFFPINVCVFFAICGCVKSHIAMHVYALCPGMEIAGR